MELDNRSALPTKAFQVSLCHSHSGRGGIHRNGGRNHVVNRDIWKITTLVERLKEVNACITHCSTKIIINPILRSNHTHTTQIDVPPPTANPTSQNLASLYCYPHPYAHHLVLRKCCSTRHSTCAVIRTQQNHPYDQSLDRLHYKLQLACKPNTKRQVPNLIASIYDPCGFLAPCITSAKCYMQTLWASNLNWDEPIPPPLSEKWQTCLVEHGA